MQSQPDKSELECFTEVSEELTKTQHQLHRDYHVDRFLGYQLLVAAEVPHIPRSFIDEIPVTAQEAMQRITTLLSSEPRSAGANFVNQEEGQVNYNFGKYFGEHVKKHVKGIYDVVKKENELVKVI